MFTNSQFYQLISLTLWGTVTGAVIGLPITVYSNELQNTLTVRSDIQEANSETGVVTARGNVKIYYPARQIQATAAQAQYFSREKRLVLSGNVYVLQEGNSMRAETMTYLIDQGHFIAMPKDDQQVESIYIVSDSEDSETQIIFDEN